MPIHWYHIDLQNSCHVRDICHVWDNITCNVSSILEMHGSKCLLYFKSTICQYLLSNKMSMFKAHPYKTWLLIKYCNIQYVLEWEFSATIRYVHFQALWIHCAVKKEIFKETPYTKVHFCVWHLRGLNKLVAPMDINE